MNWIELVGPSGIGKSTFLNALVQKKKSENWVTKKEGLYDIIKTRKTSRLEDKLFQFYFKQELINRNKHLIYTYGLEREKAFKCEAEKYNYLLEASLQHMTSLHGMKGVEKVFWITWYKSMIEEMCIFDFYKFQKMVLLEKGVISSVPFYTRINWKKQHILPRGFIFFHLDAASNYERIKKRAREGVVRTFHEELNDRDLKRFTEEDHEKHKNLREFLIRLNVPYVDVDLQDHLERNIKKVQSFIFMCSTNMNQ